MASHEEEQPSKEGSCVSHTCRIFEVMMHGAGLKKSLKVTT
jgi:hypothetical protein